jgi:hypothetical protein
MSPSPMRPLRKNEYVGIKRYRSRAQKLRAWARRKANAEPEQVFTPWLPLEEHRWLVAYCRAARAACIAAQSASRPGMAWTSSSAIRVGSCTSSASTAYGDGTC